MGGILWLIYVMDRKQCLQWSADTSLNTLCPFSIYIDINHRHFRYHNLLEQFYIWPILTFCTDISPQISRRKAYNWIYSKIAIDYLTKYSTNRPEKCRAEIKQGDSRFPALKVAKFMVSASMTISYDGHQNSFIFRFHSLSLSFSGRIIALSCNWNYAKSIEFVLFSILNRNSEILPSSTKTFSK